MFKIINFKMTEDSDQAVASKRKQNSHMYE